MTTLWSGYRDCRSAVEDFLAYFALLNWKRDLPVFTERRNKQPKLRGSVSGIESIYMA